jgi:hypothetical protein
MSKCNKCNGTFFVCENHPDQEAHQCKNCRGAGMPCECTKMSEPIENPEQLAEPFITIIGVPNNIWKAGFDCHGNDISKHIGTHLYTNSMRKLSDEEINEAKIEAVQEYYKVFPKVVIYTPIFFDELFARAILKKASEK